MGKLVQGSLIAAGLSLAVFASAATASAAGASKEETAKAASLVASDVSAARKAKLTRKDVTHYSRVYRARAAARVYGPGPAYGPGPDYGAAPAYGPAAAVYPGALRFGDPGIDTVGSIYYGPGTGPYGANRVTGEVYSKCYSDLGYGRVEPCDHGGGGGLN